MLASIAEREQTRTLLRAKIQQITDSAHECPKKISVCLSMLKNAFAVVQPDLTLDLWSLATEGTQESGCGEYKHLQCDNPHRVTEIGCDLACRFRIMAQR